MSFRRSVFRKPIIIRSESLDIVDEISVSNSRIELIQDSDIRNQCHCSLKIKEGAHRIFSLSRNPFQKLDAAKAMLVANKRIDAVTSNYNQMHLKEDQGNGLYKGQVNISGIKIPLVWRSLNSSLVADGVYVLFCIIQVGNEVRETQLICDIDHTIDDVVFKDIIQIDDVSYDSKCLIELYGFVTSSSNVNLQRARFRKITNSESFKMNINNSLNNKKSLFQILGTVELSLSDVSRTEISCDLCNYKFNTDCDIPLFGTLSCSFIMIPMSKIKCLFSEQAEIKFLSFDNVKDTEFQEYHCELKDKAIYCWKYSSHIIESLSQQPSKSLVDREDVETADYIIPIIRITKLDYKQAEDNKLCLRVCTYFDEDHEDYQEILLFNDRVETLYHIILNHITEQDVWGDLFNYENFKRTPTSFLRHGSVYRASNSAKN